MKVKLISYTPDPEKLVATAARVCYSNKADIDTIAEDFTEEEIEKFIRQLKSTHHLSVFEHIAYSFAIEGVSRVVTHELCRHRIASYSMRSQRYCSEDKHNYIYPEGYEIAGEDMRDMFEASLANSVDEYKDLVAHGLPKEIARYVLPNATATRLIVTMNARELLHFFNLRCCRRAQGEMRELAYLMLAEVRKVSPLIFEGAGPSCVSLGYCPEGDRCCGYAPTLQKVMEGYKAYVRQQKSSES